MEAKIAAPVLDDAGKQREKEWGELNAVLIWAGRE